MLDGRLEADARQRRGWRERVDSPAVPATRRYRVPAKTLDARALPMPPAITTPVVFVVDADASVRESLQALIREAGWRAETFACAQHFLTRPRICAPSCLVLDVTLPDTTGLDVQKRVAADRADMPIIFITGCADVPTTVQAMKAGALDFFVKPLCDELLLGAIERGIDRSRSTRRDEAEAKALKDRHASLTRREREVMALVAAGRLNKQAASELGISEITVKAHRGNVMRKMHADSFATLVGMAAQLGLAAASMRCGKT
jgi:FixJ family two-component response regulator